MRRAILMTGMLTGGLLFASIAAAKPDAQFERSAAMTSRAPPAAELVKLWQTVGKCVVGRDRNASIAFVQAPAGSEDAMAAARRLDPVFASCLAGSRVPGPSSIVLRRAALANALGVALPRI
jgi:hypothetical protein